MESNQDADSEIYSKQKKELEDVAQPIIAKLYQNMPPPPPDAGAGDKDEL